MCVNMYVGCVIYIETNGVTVGNNHWQQDSKLIKCIKNEESQCTVCTSVPATWFT